MDGEVPYRFCGPQKAVHNVSWHETPDLCRSAVRLKLPYDDGDEMVGFRVATQPASGQLTR